MTNQKHEMRTESFEILSNFEALPSDALVRINVVAAHEACSGSTIWRRIRLGVFPKPVKQGGITAWRVGDIRAHHARLREVA
jgi:hypothetical protein